MENSESDIEASAASSFSCCSDYDSNETYDDIDENKVQA
jgi:hypothetical protein